LDNKRSKTPDIGKVQYRAIRESSKKNLERKTKDENFSKPYPKDYRRPKEAEEILAGNLEIVMRLLKERGLKEEEIAIGFLDETSPQLTANTVRVWSFGKPEILKNTERIRSNTIGFYAKEVRVYQGFWRVQEHQILLSS
jgi:hypothetical protein